MTFLSWRTDYEIGVAQIDAEHRSLLDLVNEFHDISAQSATSKDIALVLNRLVSYAEEHFQREEKLMSDNGYPLLEAHRELHVQLVTSIFAINERFASQPAKASKETLQFIKTWLIDHIIKHDMDIGDFLRRKSNEGNRSAPGKSGQKTEE